VRIHLAPTLKVALPLLSIAVAGCSAAGDPDNAAGTHPRSAPNIILVQLDDATKAQYTTTSMPFTRRYMARRGTTFSDYLVTSPLCCPARASILTGQYGHNNGVLKNTYENLRHPGNVLPVWLQRAGYRTAHLGKFLNNYETTLKDDAEVLKGWDEWFTQLEPQRYLNYDISRNGERVSFGDAPHDYLTRVLTARALELIDEFSMDDEPFYLQLDYYAPHSGAKEGRCHGSALPDPIDEGRFAGASVPDSPALREPDRSDKPPFIRGLPRLTARRRTEADVRYACAIESLRAVDRGVERIASRLRAVGLLDETALVLSSDNGLFYGEHGIPEEKHFPYREAYEVPLQIALPTGPGEAGKTVGVPAASIDLAPTFLQLARAEPCASEDRCRTLDGRSLLPALDGITKGFAHRARGIELTLTENREPYDRVCEYYGIRLGRWSYIKHVSAAKPGQECRPSGAVEIYDLEADPHQLENLAGVAGGVESRLSARAREVRDCAGTRPDGSSTPCP